MSESTISNALDFSVMINGVTFQIRAGFSSPNEQRPPQQRYHMHYSWEVQYLYEGTEELQIENRNEPFVLHPGEFCLISPNIYHCSLAKDLLRFCFNFMIPYSPDNNHGKNSDLLRLRTTLSRIGKLRILKDDYITATMEQFRKISECRTARSEMYQNALLINVILRFYQILLSETAEQHTPDKHQKPLDRKWMIEEHIASDYDKPDGISRLAKQLYLSERRTSELVQQIMGENYKKLITRQRLEIANIMILTTDMPLSEIAFRVGYHSYNGFYLAYVKQFGMPPEKTRQSLLQKNANAPLINRKFYSEKDEPKP